MKRKHPHTGTSQQSARRWWAGPSAFLVSMLALPVNAGIVIPDDPLTTSARVAPNILFILDDSGSMAWRNMNNQDIGEITGPGEFSSRPDANGVSAGTGISSETTGNSRMYMQSYATNSLYYNPAVKYQPWMGADGNRLTGGTDFTAVYSSDLNVTHSGAGTSGGSKDLSANTQTFYVPKNVASTSTAYLSNVSNYYRYQILPGNSGIRRGVYGAVAITSRETVQIDGSNVDTGTLDNNTVVDNRLASVVAGVGLVITIENTTSSTRNRDMDYQVNSPSGTRVCSGTVSRGRSVDCSLSVAEAGQYTVKLQRATSNSTSYSLSALRYTTNSCDAETSGYGWIDCTSDLPASRTDTANTVQAEKANFATWYSYHRTRTKAAKAGAAEAFSPLNSKVRVGFRTIWGRNSFDIPVRDGNDGRFVNNVADSSVPGSTNTTSRSTWYNRLFAAGASDGTPLQSALDDAGRYFSSSSASGPYGPEEGSNQLSCRQNFSILTTDGYWNTSTVDSGNADGTSGSAIKGSKEKTYTYSPAAPYSDSYSKTLADVAMKYWKTDLRTEDYMGNTTKPANNNVPTTDADPAFWQHMVTFGISIGLKTTMGWSSVEGVPANPAWPDPKGDTCTSRSCPDVPARLDDLLHAAVNGRGQFVAASSPSEFTAGLGKALAAIAQRTGSFSNVATNSASLNTGSKVFSASYVSGVWTGEVRGRAVTRDGVGTGWTSSIPAFADRNVLTYGSTFPTSAQQTALTRTGGPADYAVTGEANANYIKGDSSNEERNRGLLRNRSLTVLGDIVGSSPFYVKETDTLYVGANDGMLHAFDGSGGQELFAYVPGIINFTQLGTLSRGDYAHKFFVDGPVVVTNRALTPNRNILVGTLGRGGKGMYALDVTAPADATATSISLWERAETTDGNMGQVLGRPILAKVQGSTSAAVVFGNGINSSHDRAVLVVLNAETGEVIREIDTGAGSADAPNGLSAATGIYGPDGRTLAYVYAGDMLGNVWKFNLTNTSAASWTATKLFTAQDEDGNAQPISAGVTVATNPWNNKRWVFFGTGRYLTVDDADSSNTAVQGMYGFMDEGSAVERSELTQRRIQVTSATQDGYPVRAFEGKAKLPSDSKGWYIDLPDTGERIVQDAQVVSSYLLTASMIPTGNACEADGRGYINALDAFTGTSASTSYFDLDRNSSTNDTVNDLPIGSVDAGVGMPTLPNLMRGVMLVAGSNGEIVAVPTIPPRWERVSWRDLKGD
ncbi:PilC/PilY family type IV pilus protein [Stenotrophomonas sp. MYb238]|uniref:pilus assembly protein n=1 Tax=Stenotrophomonas sp. MYb238 TaxID=2040281 RepID=UPI001884B852|nr:PilC/PilY family type IV pilus protein [Stenotrophomonas sp. MYb238]